MNKIPLYLKLIRKIYFTDVNHLEKHMDPKILRTSRRCINSTYITGYADGEFEPLKNLIEFLPEGTLVNMAAANKHVTNI